MDKIIIILVLGFLLTQCTSKNEDKAIKAVTALSQAQSVVTVSGFERSAEKGDLNYKGLELANSPLFDKEVGKEEELLSISALVYFQNLDKGDLKDKNAIKMKIKSQAKDGEKEVDATYKIEDLKTVLAKSKQVNKVIEPFLTQDYLPAYRSLSRELRIKTLDSAAFISSFQNMDYVYGKVKSYTLQSFELDKGYLDSVTEIDAIYFLWVLEREHASTGMIVGVRRDSEALEVVNWDVLQ